MYSIWLYINRLLCFLLKCRASKPAPVVTETYTNTLEEMIIRRIKDEKFDNVVPRDPPATAELDNPDMLAPELSQEKSKVGLGEVYANEMLERMGHVTASSAAATEAEETLRRTVRGLFNQITQELDGLSHFYFTPKPVSIEGEIATAPAVPAIMLEDIAPYRSHVGHQSNSTLEPEQVYEKKRGRDGALAGYADKEITQDDRKRLRRVRKEAHKKKAVDEKARDRTTAQTNPDSAEYRALQNKKTNDILSSDKRVVAGKIAGGGGGKNGDKKEKSYSKSTDFFSSLQEQVSLEIKGGGANKGRKRMESEAEMASRSSNAYKL